MAEDRIARYTALLEAQPANDLARFSLGRAFYDAGRFAEAAEAFRACLQRKPDWLVAALLLGRCELELGHRAEAKQCLENARQLAADQGHDGPLREANELLASL